MNIPTHYLFIIYVPIEVYTPTLKITNYFLYPISQNKNSFNQFNHTYIII